MERVSRMKVRATTSLASEDANVDRRRPELDRVVIAAAPFKRDVISFRVAKASAARPTEGKLLIGLWSMATSPVRFGAIPTATTNHQMIRIHEFAYLQVRAFSNFE
jgi:hypothetical protein